MTFLNRIKALKEGLVNWAYVHGFKRLVDRQIEEHLLLRHHIFGGDSCRLHVARSASLMNALCNVSSGEIWIEDNVSLGHNVCLLTGAHDPALRGAERQNHWPTGGRDIIIREGTWIASNVTIIGPAEIGAHSVIAAGAVVRGDIPPGAMAAGVPAKVVKELKYA
jgi:acetyltransferase-like isoleucine patch superfamily enzyme